MSGSRVRWAWLDGADFGQATEGNYAELRLGHGLYLEHVKLLWRRRGFGPEDGPAAFLGAAHQGAAHPRRCGQQIAQLEVVDEKDNLSTAESLRATRTYGKFRCHNPTCMERLEEGFQRSFARRDAYNAYQLCH
jgi:hypothetical protein